MSWGGILVISGKELFGQGSYTLFELAAGFFGLGGDVGGLLRKVLL